MQRQQRGGSSAGAAADSPAPSANAPTHTPLNATDALTYASSSFVEDGGRTALTASLLAAATTVPVETSTAVANAPPLLTMTPLTTTLPTPTATAMAMETTLFVKLNLI